MNDMIRRLTAKARAEGVGGVLRACLMRLRARHRVVHPIETVLPKLVKSRDIAIIQVGAFEGATQFDPLYGMLHAHRQALLRQPKDSWKLVLVEPVGEHFTKLRDNYSFLPGTRFENVAIAAQPGKATLYHLGVRPEDHGYPAWLAQLSSLKRERLEEMWNRYEANPEYQAFYLKHRVETTVECLTMAQLLERHGIAAVSLLQIDAEGFEGEILRSLPFQTIPFRFINFESVLLGDDKPVCERLLHKHGYHMVDFGQDTFCYRPEDERLFPKWVGHAGRTRAQALAA